MRKKTIWTVAAGTTAAVLVPGVAYALVAGGSGSPQQAPGIVGGEQSAVQPAAATAPDADADAGSLRHAESEQAAGSDNAPQQLPAVEQMASAGSGPTVSAVSPLSAVSAASPAPGPQQSSSSKSSSTKQAPKEAPAPAQSADSPDTPDTPDTPDSPDSPESPGSAD